jgi:cell pole-organizing protein PopZ
MRRRQLSKESLTRVRRSGYRQGHEAGNLIVKEDVTLARCVTCGTELHPERAEKYDYCTKADCQAKNARSLTIAAVGVNKAADQYVILDERTQKELAGGRYRDARRASPISPAQPRSPRRRAQKAGTPGGVLHRSEQTAESWTEAQQNLALALHMTGRKSLEEIAKRLSLRPDTVAKMIVAAKRRWRR